MSWKPSQPGATGLTGFRVEAEILSGTSRTPHGTLLVDVGGGKGHDLEQLLARFRLARRRVTRYSPQPKDSDDARAFRDLIE